MSKVDWTKAPEGAEFYSNGRFRKKNLYYDFDMISWLETSFSNTLLERSRDYEPNPNLSELPKIVHGTEETNSLSKYHVEIKRGVYVDVYDVLRAFDVRCPALQHLIKKALKAGDRGHKTKAEDMDDIVKSAQRALELFNE